MSIDSKITSEVTLLLKQLDDQVEKKFFSEAAGVIKQLAALPISVSVLSATKAGMRVNKLKAHENADLSAAAKECTSVWRKVAEAAGVQTSSGTPRATAGAEPAKAQVKTEAPVKPELHRADSVSSAASSVSVSSTPSASSGTVPEVVAAKAAASSGSASAGSTGSGRDSATDANPLLKLSSTRQRVKDALGKVFTEVMTSYWSSLPADAAEESMEVPRLRDDQLAIATDALARAIEAAMFEQLGGGTADKPAAGYNEQFRLLAFNLKRNVSVALNIFAGNVEPEAVARFTSDDLVSEDARKAAEKALKEQTEAQQLDWYIKNKQNVRASAGLSTTQEGMLTCRRCRSKNTEYYQKQTRSADEPMTTFATCNDCGMRWRFC